MKIILKMVKVRVEKYYNNASVVMSDYYFVFIIDREVGYTWIWKSFKMFFYSCNASMNGKNANIFP